MGLPKEGVKNKTRTVKVEIKDMLAKYLPQKTIIFPAKIVNIAKYAKKTIENKEKNSFQVKIWDSKNNEETIWKIKEEIRKMEKKTTKSRVVSISFCSKK